MIQNLDISYHDCEDLCQVAKMHVLILEKETGQGR